MTEARKYIILVKIECISGVKSSGSEDRSSVRTNRKLLKFRKMSFLKSLFGQKESNISEIGMPTNVVHGIHVERNKLTGHLEGLPNQWKKFLDTQFTQGTYTSAFLFILS